MFDYKKHLEQLKTRYLPDSTGAFTQPSEDASFKKTETPDWATNLPSTVGGWVGRRLGEIGEAFVSPEERERIRAGLGTMGEGATEIKERVLDTPEAEATVSPTPEALEAVKEIPSVPEQQIIPTKTLATQGISETPEVPEKTSQIGAIQETIRNLQTQAQTIQAGLGSLEAPPPVISQKTLSPEEQQYRQLQSDIMGRIATSLPEYKPETIMGKYEERRKKAETAGEAGKKLIKSRYGEAITTEEEEGQRRLTAEKEARRGFATNTALFRQLENEGKKRVGDLERRRDDALAVQDITTADRLDNLIAQEDESMTTARTNYMNSLFALSGELRSIRGFETPEEEQVRKLQTTAITKGMDLSNALTLLESRKDIDFETKQFETLQNLQMEYGNIPGITEVKSIREAIGLLSSQLTEDRKFKLAEIQADIDLKRIQAQKALQTDGKAPTRIQYEVAGYANRLVQANSIFDTLAVVPGFESRSWWGRIAPAIIKSPEMKQQEQAERNFVNALLRRESGAAIAESEFESAEKQYFPRPFDDEITLANKKQNRLLVLQSLILEAGNAFSIENIVPFLQTSFEEEGEIPVMNIETGETGYIPEAEYNPDIYQLIE